MSALEELMVALDPLKLNYTSPRPDYDFHVAYRTTPCPLDNVPCPTGIVSKHEPPTLMKAHGIILSLAWILISTTCIIIARYYKNAWPNTTLFGKPVWFQLHRTGMCLVLTLSIIGCAVAYIYEGPYHDIDNVASVMKTVHPPCGAAVIAITALQPLVAYFRPPLDSPKRIWWYLLHVGLGLSAWFLANVNICVAFGHPNGLNLTAKLYMNGLLYTYWGITAVTLIILETHKCYLKAKNKGEKAPLKPANYEKPTFHDNLVVDHGATFLKSILCLYIGLIFTCQFGYSLILTYHGVGGNDIVTLDSN